MSERVMPHNIEAEQSILGSMFLSKYAKEKALEELSDDLFYSNANSKIFKAIKTLSEKKTAIDVTTVTSLLSDNNELGAIGGVEYLSDVINSVTTAANIEYYIEIVVSKAVLRKLIETSIDNVKMAYIN